MYNNNRSSRQEVREMILNSSVRFKTEDESIQKLFDTAKEKCLKNLKNFAGRPVLVEGGGYKKIWLETQPMGGEMYAKHNIEAALNNQLFFMETQREDGRLAGSIEAKGEKVIEPQFNKFQGFCFPFPALNMYYWIGKDDAYLDNLNNTLIGFDEYLWKTRDSNGDGCLESFCVYDTGEDNAVRYGDSPVYCTTDTPPKNSSIVPMESMDIMSFSYSARWALAEISRIKNNGEYEAWAKKAQNVKKALKEHLWDEERGACYDKDKFGNVIDVLTHNNLRCMYWGSFSQEMADRFVCDHLTDPEKFWTFIPLPSVAANDPAFRNAPENNWSGQAEGLTYQRAIRALENYGYEKLVTKLGKKFMQCVIDGGYVFVQQYDPFTGVPSRVDPETKLVLPPESKKEAQDAYGPTLLAVLEYIAHIWGVHMQLGEIWFSLAGGLEYTYEQVWGENSYRIESDGKSAKVFVNDEEKFISDTGVRLVTDESGALVRKVRIED